VCVTNNESNNDADVVASVEKTTAETYSAYSNKQDR